MNKRISFLDAAKGLAIFTVVYSHICLFCMTPSSNSVIIEFLRTFFLNAFFFISGFFAFREPLNGFKLKTNLQNKTIQLLLPSLIMGFLFAYEYSIPIDSFIYDSAKYGYWFTIVLYEMFVIWFLILAICNLIKKDISIVLIIVMSLLCYSCHKFVVFNQNFPDIFCVRNLINYFIYFGGGIISKKYQIPIKNLVFRRNGILITMIFIIIVLNNLFTLPSIIYNFIIIFIVLLILAQIYKQKFKFALLEKIKMSLAFLGKYTLEIYFLHYFLLFKLPEPLQYFIRPSESMPSSAILEFVIIGSLSLIISILCILFSICLKQIPYISLLAFGKKIKD